MKHFLPADCFEGIGIDPVGITAEEAAKLLDDEIAKWSKDIRLPA